MEDISGSIADQAALFDQAEPAATVRRRPAKKAEPKKAQPKKTEPENAQAQKAARKKATPAAPAKAVTTAKATPAKAATPAKRTRAKAAPPEVPVDATPAMAEPVETEAPAAAPSPETAPPFALAVAPAPPVRGRTRLEQFALTAVRDLGPAAQRWVQRSRERYPTADPDALARLAAYEYGRSGRRSAATVAAARTVGPYAVAGTLTRTQVELILTIAAVYGLDPTGPERVHDVITLMHGRSPKTAVAAMSQLAARVLANAATPFGASVVAAAQQTRAIADIAARACTHFRSYPVRGYNPGM
jgi:hypothetical protein